MYNRLFSYVVLELFLVSINEVEEVDVFLVDVIVVVVELFNSKWENIIVVIFVEVVEVKVEVIVIVLCFEKLVVLFKF